MPTDPLNPYQEEREPSPGEVEVERGSLLLMGFRLFKIPMPKREDEAAVERAGVLLSRWFRNLGKGTPL